MTSRSPTKDLSAFAQLSLKNDSRASGDIQSSIARSSAGSFSMFGHTKTESVVFDDNDNEKLVDSDEAFVSSDPEEDRMSKSQETVQHHRSVTRQLDPDRGAAGGSPTIYLDSFAEDPRDTKPKKKAVSIKDSRVKSAPLRLFKRYGSASHSRTGSLSSAGRGKRPRQLQRLHSAPAGHSFAGHGYRPRSTSEVHRRTCYVPGPHTVDIHNAYSIMPGPHADVHSLLGPPLCPREDWTLQHKSAWYHVPGRYPTVEQPYPPKRSQSRLAPEKGSYFRLGLNCYQLREDPSENQMNCEQANGVENVACQRTDF